MIEEIETSEQFTPAKEFIIKDLETVKVISHPLRLQVCEYLISGPRTVKEIAEYVGEPPNKLYYHINLLEKHGLIRIVKTRVVSGIIEKSYHVTAYSIRADESLLSPSGALVREGFPMMMSGMFERTAGDIKRSIDAGLIDLGNTDKEKHTLIAVHNLVRLSPEQSREFFKRFEDLIGEFNKAYSDSPDDTAYGLTVALYPTTYQGQLPKGNEDE